MKYQTRPTYDSIAAAQKLSGSPGVPIDTVTRVLMEDRFGCEFSDVRLHCGNEAEAATRFLNAQAYAIGAQIVFGNGCYDPGTADGLRLLAHELVHVLQQRRGSQSGIMQSGNGLVQSDLLEREADTIASLIVAGYPLPAQFAAHPAAFGAIQCHVDQPCPGIPLTSLRPPEVYVPANAAIEMAYKADPRHIRHADGILVGSNFDRGQIQLPKGAPNQRFGNMLLSRLRGLVHQRRPDIIDFVDRVIYEIKPVGRERQGSVQVASYYAVTDEIRREYAAFAEPPWKVEYAVWYPPHVLPFEDGSLAGDRIVCTQTTNYQTWPGLILYEVRALDDEEKRKRRQRPTLRAEVADFDPAFDEFWPALKKELRRGIPFYDPYNPEYVIIVPSEFYTARYQQWNDQQLDKFVRVKPSYDFAGGHEVLGVRRLLFVVTAVVAGAGAALVVVVAASVVLAPAAAGAAATAGVGAAATTGGVVVETTATTGIIVETAGSTAAATGGAMAGVDVATLAARAAMAAPQARNIAAGLGVLMVLATVKNAQAASRSVSNVSAIRAVPLADFRRTGGFPFASSTPRNPKLDAVGVCDAGFGKNFQMGGTVLFDGLPHNVIGQFSAR